MTRVTARQGAVDAMLHYADGRVAALEVSSIGPSDEARISGVLGCRGQSRRVVEGPSIVDRVHPEGSPHAGSGQFPHQGSPRRWVNSVNESVTTRHAHWCGLVQKSLATTRGSAGSER